MPDTTLKPCICIDIDGTLSDPTHRREHVTGGKKEWKQFFDKMGDDAPNKGVCFLASLVSHADLGVPVFVCTGRPEEYRSITEDWLEEHTGNLRSAKDILMRPSGDYRPDTVVKREMLDKIRALGYEPILVIDDRPSVVDMWRAEGIEVLQADHFWTDGPTYKPGDLHMLIGPSGAGKSYYAFENDFTDCLYLSSDMIRGQLCSDFKDQSKNAQVFALLHANVKTNIELGKNVVVDATNLLARDRRSIRDQVPQDCPIYYHVIDRPLEEKIRDAGWRASVLIKGEPLVVRHHNSFQAALPLILRGDDDPRVTVLDKRNA